MTSVNTKGRGDLKYRNMGRNPSENKLLPQNMEFQKPPEASKNYSQEPLKRT
jgi:hypothetical protein